MGGCCSAQPVVETQDIEFEAAIQDGSLTSLCELMDARGEEANKELLVQCLYRSILDGDQHRVVDCLQKLENMSMSWTLTRPRNIPEVHNRMTALSLAIDSCNYDAALYFMRKELFTQSSRFEESFLHTVCAMKDPKMVWLACILDAHSSSQQQQRQDQRLHFNWSSKDGLGRTPLMIAIMNKDLPPEAVHEVFLHSKAWDKQSKASAPDQAGILRAAGEEGALNALDHLDRGAVHYAALLGRVEVGRSLLGEEWVTHGDKPDARGGLSPLHLLARSDHWDPAMVRALRGRGAGLTPGQVAADLRAAAAEDGRAGAFGNLSLHLDHVTNLRQVMGSIRPEGAQGSPPASPRQVLLTRTNPFESLRALMGAAGAGSTAARAEEDGQDLFACTLPFPPLDAAMYPAEVMGSIRPETQGSPPASPRQVLLTRTNPFESLRALMGAAGAGSTAARAEDDGQDLFACKLPFPPLDAAMYPAEGHSSRYNRWSSDAAAERLRAAAQLRGALAAQVLAELGGGGGGGGPHPPAPGDESPPPAGSFGNYKEFFWPTNDPSFNQARLIQAFAEFHTKVAAMDKLTFDSTKKDSELEGLVDLNLDALPSDALYLRRLSTNGTVEWMQGAELVGLVPNTEQLALPLENVSPEQLTLIRTSGFQEKIEWFKTQVALLRVNGQVQLRVRRGDLVRSACDAFMALPPREFCKNFRFDFIDEQGLDYGGLSQEFWALISDQLFAPEPLGLFKYSATDHLTVQIDPEGPGRHPEDFRTLYRFAGRVMGKALLDQQPLAVHVCRPLFKHMVGAPVCLRDLAFINKDLHEGLTWMEENTGVEALCYTFSVTIKGPDGGGSQEVELVPGGRDLEVTDANKDAYARARFKWEVLDNRCRQLAELLVGLYEVVPLGLLSVFDFQELELLMCAIDIVDLDDWRDHTIYEEGFDAQSDTIIWFWQIVGGFTDEQRARLLQYVTGTSRVPLGGFSKLQGSDGVIKHFTIRRIGVNAPNAHTCFNRLDLPEFTSFDNLKMWLEGVILIDVTGFNED